MKPEANRRRVVLAGVGMLTVGWVAPIAYYLGSALRASVRQGLPLPVIAVVLTLVGALAAWWLPHGYHALRKWECQGRLYGRVGVGRFRKFVLDGPRFRRWLCLTEGHGPFAARRQLLLWRDRGRITERHHVAAMLMSLPSLYLAVRSGHRGMATYLIVGNIVFNVYPILLQRSTRVRLEQSLAGRDATASRLAVPATGVHRGSWFRPTPGNPA